MTKAKPQALFWFVHVYRAKGKETLCLAVAAFTEMSARRQARQQVGPSYTIDQVTPVMYAHAWPINLAWHPQETERTTTADSAEILS